MQPVTSNFTGYRLIGYHFTTLVVLGQLPKPESKPQFFWQNRTEAKPRF